MTTVLFFTRLQGAKLAAKCQLNYHNRVGELGLDCKITMVRLVRFRCINVHIMMHRMASWSYPYFLRSFKLYNGC